jgi:hypothetical protein
MVAIPIMIVCGLLVAASSRGPTARADNAGSDNSLEGTWRVQVTVRDCQTDEALRTFPALFIFAKGGYAKCDDRRPTPRDKHYRPGCLAAQGRPHLQRGVRDLHF